MGKKILGFDLDGVLYPWAEQILKHLQMYHGYTGDFRDLFCEGQFFNSQKKMWQENMKFIEPMYSQRPPTYLTINILDKLSNMFEFVYITERPEDLRFTTERFLRVYKFPNHESLIMCKDKVIEIRMLDIDFYVEDRGDIAVKLEPFTKVFLYAQPYNEAYRDKFETINNLYELEKILLGDTN